MNVKVNGFVVLSRKLLGTCIHTRRYANIKPNINFETLKHIKRICLIVQNTKVSTVLSLFETLAMLKNKM